MSGDVHRPHLPQRPIWLCRSCTADWPCLTARTRLAIDYARDPVGLALYLASALQSAVDDLYRLNPDPGPDPTVMHARFLAWVRPRILITQARLGLDAGGNQRRPRGGPFPAPGPTLSGPGTGRLGNAPGSIS